MFGPHRRKPIAFLVNFGDARRGRIKVGLVRSQIVHFQEKCVKLVEVKVRLDRTGASGSPSCRSYGNCRRPSPESRPPGGQSPSKGQDI